MARKQKQNIKNFRTVLCGWEGSIGRDWEQKKTGERKQKERAECTKALHTRTYTKFRHGSHLQSLGMISCGVPTKWAVEIVRELCECLRRGVKFSKTRCKLYCNMNIILFTKRNVYTHIHMGEKRAGWKN